MTDLIVTAGSGRLDGNMTDDHKTNNRRENPSASLPLALTGEWLDTFAGAGGWDHVLHSLGGRSGGVENAKAPRSTREAAGLPTVGSDVRAVSVCPGCHIGHLGSPPCTTFTVCGTGAGRLYLDAVLLGVAAYRAGRPMPFLDLVAATGDERTALVLEPLRLALEGMPMFVAWEQVPEVLPVWQACAEVLRDRGYSVVTGVLRAEEYGAPQTRKRAVLIARRDGVTARLPEPTHAPFGVSGSLLPAPVGFGTALGLPDGTVMVSNYGTGGDPKKRGRRTADQPAATITSKADRMKLHFPDGTIRNLTIREAAILQGFPDRWGPNGEPYPWRGSKTEIGLQIGNAVPGHLARAVIGVFLP